MNHWLGIDVSGSFVFSRINVVLLLLLLTRRGSSTCIRHPAEPSFRDTTRACGVSLHSQSPYSSLLPSFPDDLGPEGREPLMAAAAVSISVVVMEKSDMTSFGTKTNLQAKITGTRLRRINSRAALEAIGSWAAGSGRQMFRQCEICRRRMVGKRHLPSGVAFFSVSIRKNHDFASCHTSHKHITGTMMTCSLQRPSAWRSLVA